MDRDTIAELHFGNLRRPKYAANNVLLRLLRDGHIQRSTARQPYVYFGGETTMKKNSAKIDHFLAIGNVYKEMRGQALESFLVEPKYGDKGTVEPDIFALYRRTPFFIEVQRSVYSEKQMREKLDRYEAFFQSGIIALEPWQNPERIMFPHVLILSDTRYGLPSFPFKVFQAPTFTAFIQSITKPQPQPAS
ncbi:hypothetical protein QTN46_04380 [Bacillus amyloliquefaciens]|uniref:replication-relaxation family protein n=2 Tax=Bacillus subtilis group TaxID=653685 RepID=UPI0025A19E3E|nr:hypothetical protein [Bacillus amyloliquefaciens]WJM62879.1 hypothetical protein QTN46_04380 [Bacillus amyloliquefaciens]